MGEKPLHKDSWHDLAVWGNEPAFAEKLHVGRPNIGRQAELFARLQRILDSRWLSNNGQYVQQFEQALAERLNVRHCIAMCNATIALEITIRALGLAGEVIVPSFTFVATPHSLQWQGITPVFCDIDPLTHNLDPDCLERLITPRTSGIIGVHLWGRPCDVGRLEEIAARHGLALLFDAAHAFGCSHQGKMIGGFGRAEVFSFHATKYFNTFEGGAVATNDDRLAEKIRLMKNFGFAGYDKVIYIGTNGKMSEISAAMGLTGLESLDDFVATNRRNYHAYLHGLGTIAGITPVRYDERQKGNYQYVACEVDEERCGLSRDMLLDLLHAENIVARRYFYPGCHRMEPYRTLFPDAHRALPVTERLARRILSFPTGTSVTTEDIARICSLVGLMTAHSASIRERLAQSPRHAAPPDCSEQEQP